MSGFELRRRALGSGRTVADPSGAFEAKVGAGPYRLVVERTGYHPLQTAPFLIEPGESRTCDLAVEPATAKRRKQP